MTPPNSATPDALPRASAGSDPTANSDPATCSAGPSPSGDPDPRARRRTRWVRAAQVGVGLSLGLALAEGGFWLRDDGAFPHVNFYIADPDLGARLEPGASMRFRLGDNPTTTIHVNAQGFRGDDWGPPEPEQILVLGDSQVFGLGVEDGETFSARLAELTGRPVLNAGVPTYGPDEYLALAETLLEERSPKTVVYVLNFVNDPFELGRPNTERHVVWDGWAVRRETASDLSRVRAFPGRRWLMSQSHLVYGLRRWWHQRDEQARAETTAADAGVASEGQWQDLLQPEFRTSVETAKQRRAELEVAQAALQREIDAAERREAEHSAALEEAVNARETELEELEEQISELDGLIAGDPFGSNRDRLILGANPGDIIRDTYSESTRSITVTAEMYAAAAKRKKTRSREAARDKAARKAARKPLLARRDALLATESDIDPEGSELETDAPAPGAELDAELPIGVDTRSVFEPHLAELRALCDRHQVELLVVALPLDVQVSQDEWTKYGVEDGPDMFDTLILLDDLGASARHLGVASLDATQTLRAAEPGAFLQGDIHMTAKGHRALGDAIAEALEVQDLDPLPTPQARQPESMQPDAEPGQRRIPPQLPKQQLAPQPRQQLAPKRPR